MELTRAQKRLILMFVDIFIIYISGYISYLFLSEYIGTTGRNLLQVLTCVAILYVIVGLITQVFSIINRYTDYKTLSKISLALGGAYFVIALIGTIFSLSISYRFLLLSCMFSVLFTVSIRLAWRMWHSFKTGANYEEVSNDSVLRTLVVGAGDGERFSRYKDCCSC